ncbi:MAG TPA: glycosyltransferase family 4 protein [Candidatus Bathyarchaeia archaeon]|nr:glycosyltransferase family 4 protein [Candidatus Bathyarchaeia archaeon]
MKIGILYSHLKELGGAERVILKQVDMFRKQGHEADCYFAYVDKNLRKESANPHCYTKSYFNSLIPNNPLTRIILSIPLAPLTLSAIADEEVLICHGYGPAPWIGYLNKKIRGTSYISYIHSPPRFLYLNPAERALWRFNDVRETIFKLSRIMGPALKEIDYHSVVNSDIVLANSHFTAKRIRNIYGIDAGVCYPPVDIETFNILEEPVIKELRKSFGWPLILSTGRIVAVKRWEWLMEIMSYIARDFPSAMLAITGEISKENNKYINKLLKTAKKLNIEKNIKFLGFKSQHELVELYNVADAYVYSVPREDFGLGPVEAMACGTPSVVWNDGGGPCETVIDGRTGFKAEPYDTEDFAEKTMKTVEIDREEIACKTRVFVEENFSSEKHMKILEETIRKLR